MSADGATCDACGAAGTPYYVDSALALRAWNREHPDDTRTRLYFCTQRCCFQAGFLMGLRDDAAGTA